MNALDWILKSPRNPPEDAGNIYTPSSGGASNSKASSPKVNTMPARMGIEGGFLGGDAYNQAMEFGVGKGYYPNQITYQEMPWLNNASQDVLSALGAYGYADYGEPYGLIHDPTVYAPEDGGGGGGGGGGSYGVGGGGTVKIKWKNTYSIDGAPEWWQGLTPDHWTPESEYIAMLNAMIPFMSPEDQRTAAQSLTRMNADYFGGYNPETVQFAIPTEISTPLRRDYQSSQRAQGILEALSNMISAAGKKEKDLGPGYGYLRQIADAMKDYGGTATEAQTRAQQTQLLGALDPLMAESKGDALSAYGGVARMLEAPFFSAGQLLPVQRLQDGSYLFGKPNPQYY